MAEGHRRRMIEKVLKYGVDILHEHEFLELYLFFAYKRSDTNPIAHSLLKKFGNIANICNAPIEELMEVEGVGKSTATTIKLLPHITRGYQLNTSVSNGLKYVSRESIYKRCEALLSNTKNEVVYLLCFDKSMHLIKEVKLAEGVPEHVSLDVRKITDALAGTATSAVVLCHNHPSGVLIPSNQDFNTTNYIMRIMKTMNVDFIDHVLVADNRAVSCVSFKEVEL